MQIPILKQGEYLVATVQAAFTDADLRQFQTDIVVQVGKHRSRGVIIDVSAMDVVDSFGTRVLQSVAHMVQLRGAHAVIVGIQPDVAFSMVQLGLRFEGVATLLDLEDGLAFLHRQMKEGSRHGP